MKVNGQEVKVVARGAAFWAGRLNEVQKVQAAAAAKAEGVEKAA